MNTQMPPTRSIRRASTVAKIGRPMKKLTMAVLVAVGLGVSSMGDAGPGTGLRAAGHGFRSGSRGLPPSASLFLAAVPGTGARGASVEAGSAFLVTSVEAGLALGVSIEAGSALTVAPERASCI